MKPPSILAFVLALSAVCMAGEDRWRDFDALTASDPNCSVGMETWTHREGDGKVSGVERKFRVTVRWKQWEDGTQITHVFWWSVEPTRRKAFLECADWLDEADRRIAVASPKR
jgi:hypothetical protein